MVYNRFEKHPEYSMTKKQIENSIFQQVMSKDRPYKFSIFKQLDTFVAHTQLERLVVANLKKNREAIYGKEKS